MYHTHVKFVFGVDKVDYTPILVISHIFKIKVTWAARALTTHMMLDGIQKKLIKKKKC